MKMLDMRVVIGIPAYNERKNIAGILVEIKKLYQNIIVCDDGSNDLTAEIAEQLGATVIRHDRNLGYGAAIKSIFLKAEEIKADILITFDADGQHRIEDIDSLLTPIKNNKADIVIGSRFLENFQSEVPKYRKIGIKVITKITNSTLKENLTDSQSGLRAYNKQALEKIELTEKGMGISTEILIKGSKTGLRIAEVPIKILYHKDSSTHDPVSHGTSVIFSTLRLITIQRPLTFYGIPGLVFLIMGLIFVGWTLQLYAESGSIITNVTLIGIGLSIIGVLLLITATILHSILIILSEKRN